MQTPTLPAGTTVCDSTSGTVSGSDCIDLFRAVEASQVNRHVSAKQPEHGHQEAAVNCEGIDLLQHRVAHGLRGHHGSVRKSFGGCILAEGF